MTSLRPRPSYATTADESASQYVSAQSYMQDTTQESMWTAPSPPNSTNLPYFDDSSSTSYKRPSREDRSIEVLSTPRRPPFHSIPSSSSSITSTTSSSGSEVDMSGSIHYPFFVAPPPPPASARTPMTHDKENVRTRTSLIAPSPRPTSPLPPLPKDSTIRHLRAPSNTTTTSHKPYRAPPLTAHNSLAAFQAHHLVDKPSSSEDSHRTSSDVDLDLSFDYEARQDLGDQTFSDEQHSGSRSGSSSSEENRSGEGSLEKLEHEVMRGGWVGIEMSPQDHGIPEGQLVRSGSGKLVGAQSSKARSALDLRAQFKAAELEKQRLAGQEQDVSIVVMEELGNMVDEGAEVEARRREIRAGKRPVEGERAGWIKTGVDKVQRRRSAGLGFAYNPTESLKAPALRNPPHSAPLLSEPVFANQQQQRPPPAHQVVDLSPFSAELDQAKRTKAFPLPLRLTKRLSLTTSPKHESVFKSSRQSLVYYDSDVASSEPSPIFDHHTDDEDGGGGTNRTAPSTPNDTPLFQECFSDDETTPPPLPDKDGALAGLGFDFDLSPSREEFPTVPLRRRSLPPPATRRMSNRHMPIPSLSISPPPRNSKQSDLPLEDILETDSSRSSQDSSVDPNTSPSRRLSRRLSSSNPGIAGIGAQTRRQPSSSPPLSSSPRHATSTPNNERGGPTIITPQHLLVTPTPTSTSSSNGTGGGPSFSFSPAPLRLVKAQLLRAAGYRYDAVPASSPPLAEPPTTSIDHAIPSPRKRIATPQPQLEETNQVELPPRTRAGLRSRGKGRVGTTLEELSDLLSSSAETWIDEVIPAKLAFIVSVFFPFLPRICSLTDPTIRMARLDSY